MRYALHYLPAYDVVLIETQGAVGPPQDAGVLAADLLLDDLVDIVSNTASPGAHRLHPCRHLKHGRRTR